MNAKSTRTVQADHVDAGHFQARFEVVANRRAIAVEPLKKPVDRVIHSRDVVISRDDQPRLWQGIHEFPRGLELAPAGPHGQIAAEDRKVRSHRCGEFEKRRGNRWIGRAEMGVGKMEDSLQISVATVSTLRCAGRRRSSMGNGRRRISPSSMTLQDLRFEAVRVMRVAERTCSSGFCSWRPIV